MLIYSINNPSNSIKYIWGLDPLLTISPALTGKPGNLIFLTLTIITLTWAAIFGRSFCGWICPIGFIQDLTPFKGSNPSLPKELRQLKYTILAGGLFTALVSGWTFLEWINPLTLFNQTIGPLSGKMNWINPGTTILVSTVTLSTVLEKRIWCRYLCPLGAVLSLTSMVKFVRIRPDGEKCIKCLRCEKDCTMGIIDLKVQRGLTRDSECILCLACRDTCPVEAIDLAFKARR